ncbi:protease inhibitor Inh/omp19 family protein [Pelagibacterium flavum]|uniref:Protease inhibitor Inh/omp19 family protein n=1 Tax=Pelagibacterium flavum TaxID=2984530 RepID=A0ABY6IRU7_9HYPH|nr:protease inhibitor Inh/omp19 family protein [Pelagibacterium sp. YIM 151497]UYQ72440.1 protease inhibitor Inh/omp19 family protein [Pelagibacterium sp. YIM 151497]
MVGTLTRSLAVMMVIGGTGVLSACSPTSFGRATPTVTATPPPPTIQPVQTSSVSSSDLPPIDGSTVLPSNTPSTTGTPTVPGNTASVDGSTSTSSPGFLLDDVGSPGNTTSGRNLTGSVTIEQLLGGWTVMVGAEQCRLNLTYTAKGSTGRYRASTPGCLVDGLADVTSWNLLGNQIQFYNESDELVGTLFQSGNRFVGTLAGGQSVSMVG